MWLEFQTGAIYFALEFACTMQLYILLLVIAFNAVLSWRFLLIIDWNGYRHVRTGKIGRFVPDYLEIIEAIYYTQ